jgi:hypothetical protein
MILSAAATDRFAATCIECDRPIAATVPGVAGDHRPVPCPNCGTTSDGERIYGTLTGNPCNAACEGATGKVCECGCGGLNHGGVWTAHDNAVASQIAAWRQERDKRERVKAQRRQSKRAAWAAAFEQWRTDSTDVVEFLERYEEIPGLDFLWDMRRTLGDGRALTAGQTSGVRRCIEATERWAAERAARLAAAVEPVTGNGIEITGTVTRVDVTDTAYGPRRTMTIRDDRGFRVTGTCPESLWSVQRPDGNPRPGLDHGSHGIGNGDRVRFLANVTTATWSRDPDLAQFKRPRKAELLEFVPAVVAADA